MRITLARIENYKNVRHAEVRPHADRALLFIAGPNASGKTSLLDAIQVLLQGKSAQAKDPIRHGAPHAEIYGETDTGLMIRRKITAGSSTLEVRSRDSVDGPMKRPQEVLNGLIGAAFIDPLEFLRETPRDQRAFLLKLVDSDGAIAKTDAAHEKVFAFRTEVGRKRDHAEGEFKRLGEAQTVGEETDVAALAEERKRIADVERRCEVMKTTWNGATQRVAAVKRELDEREATIKRLEQQLSAAREALALSQDNLETAIQQQAKAQADAAATRAEWDATIERAQQVDRELAAAGTHNSEVYRARLFNERREAARLAFATLEGQYEAQSGRLAELDQHRKDILAAAKLPVTGLGFSSEGITFRGVPLAQASQAERIRVAVGLAIASAPGLDDIFIRDAALLDDKSLALVEEMAAAAGKTVWLEVIRTDVDGAIIMQDGEIADEQAVSA